MTSGAKTNEANGGTALPRTGSPSAARPSLLVAGLSAGYGGAVIVRDVDLCAYAGEVVCLLGRNGAGKTTIMKALMGLLPRDGRVELEGSDITRMRGSRIKRKGMVCVPQDDQVIAGLSVAEHFSLAVPGVPESDLIAQAAETFGVLGERSSQDAATLSGGERKMLGIALALACEPAVVLLDEPTEGVAPVTVELLVSAIAGTGANAAVVLVEQNLDVALSLGERVYVLETGRIVEEGTLSELYESGQLEKRLTL